MIAWFRFRSRLGGHALSHPRTTIATSSLFLLTVTLSLQQILSSPKIRSTIHPKNEQIHRNTQQITPSRQEKINSFSLLSATQIHTLLSKLSRSYPTLTNLTTTQELYNLPTAGHPPNDCPYDDDVPGCYNHVLTISSSNKPDTPEVFLSGALHGDERVGPTVVMETARLLLRAAHCTSLPSPTVKSTDGDAWEAELTAARDCRDDLSERGITPSRRRWLSRLVATRRIVVLPTANALGFFRNKREEGNIDPNRDFPYDLQDYTRCMVSIAGRSVNEIFRSHLFQLAVTFHGGMEAVGYEWGAPSYSSFVAPDSLSQADISRVYSTFGGEVKGKTYPVGTMNELVYPVRGGMEDWAYAGSWDTQRVNQCKPRTYGGYDAEKTKYGNGTLRMFNVLVETSDSKEPQTNIGTDEDLFNPKGKGSGHVPRNIRLALSMIDLVEPYVVINSVEDIPFEEDIIPGIEVYTRSCIKTRAVLVPEGGLEFGMVPFSWTVGGGITVDETYLMYAKWDDIAETSPFDGTTQPTQKQLDDFFADLESSENKNTFKYSDKQTGKTSWGTYNPFDGENYHKDTAFTSTIDVSGLRKGDKLAVFAVAKVDQSWKDNVDGNVKGNLAPQTHVVNARTNPEWRYESTDGEQLVQGRLLWFSVPVTVVVGSAKTAFMEISIRNPLDESELEWIDDDLLEERSYRFLFTVIVSAYGIIFIGLVIWKLMHIRDKKLRHEHRGIQMRECDTLQLDNGITILS
eukprot:CAMPEP_0172521950 /NCGR_PEP_ID=MMETSP1066-20121228/292860_1 /TAXON_ID=671091 /ORGANISM="Coscinodiscus wailesii, Strain CCMP2513" /LENGTH=742 /DNA_ID=CAMNT_0013304913 /DNA_START=12 /DNA_END=2240 /DNA_ORIENTATION=-